MNEKTTPATPPISTDTPQVTPAHGAGHDDKSKTAQMTPPPEVMPAGKPSAAPQVKPAPKI